jgi:putative transposase
VILAHKICLVPTPAQESYFRRAAGTARFTYNWALAEWKREYEAGGRPNGRALKRRFNAIRGTEYPWTYDVHRDCTARPFDDLQAAFKRLFRRVAAGEKPGYPRFKRKGVHDAFYIANDKVRFDGKRIRIPRLGWVKMREVLRFEGKVLGVVVKRVADRWYAVVQVDVGDLRRPRTGNGIVGVDLGIKASATLSTGEVVPGPKALARHLRKLRRLSRRFSRKRPGSRGRRRLAGALARLHARIANIRKDHLGKLSTRLCRENQAVGIEDLRVAGMVRNRRLARSIIDEAWGQLRWMLAYKSQLYGTDLVVHDRWFPSSKACSRCGHVKDKLPLSVRTYSCDACGLVIDRDLNAALNLEPTLGHRGSDAGRDCAVGRVVEAGIETQPSRSR